MLEENEDIFKQRQDPPLLNRRRNPVVTWAILTVNGLVWLATTVDGGSENLDVMLKFGAMYGPFIAAGEYWRLFTAMFLHFGASHLLFNSISLLIYGQIVERFYGQLRFTGIYFFAGLVGSITSFIFNPLALAAGASGAIFGVLGALAAYFVVQRDVLGSFGRHNLIAILVLMTIQILYGFNMTGVDNWAHMGGFSAGFLIGFCLSPRYEDMVSPFGTPINSTKANLFVREWWIVPVGVAMLLIGCIIGSARVPDNPFDHLFVAERHYKSNNLQQALDEIEKAIELEPYLGASYYLRGRVLMELGDDTSALEELAMAVRLGEIRMLGNQQTKRDAIAFLVSIDQRGNR